LCESSGQTARKAISLYFSLDLEFIRNFLKNTEQSTARSTVTDYQNDAINVPELD